MEAMMANLNLSVSDNEHMDEGFSSGHKVKHISPRSKPIKLPDAPTHTPGLAITLMSDDDDDDDGDDVEDPDFVPAEQQGSSKKRKRTSNPNGRSYNKVSDKKAQELIDAVQSLHQRGENELIKKFVRSFDFTHKQLGDLKIAMTRKLLTSAKVLTAKSTSTVTYLTSLPNDNPDKILEQQLIDPSLTFAELIKMKSAHEDDIREIEEGLSNLKEQLKIYQLACEVHPEKTTKKEDTIGFIFKELADIEMEKLKELRIANDKKRTAAAFRFPN